MPVFRIIASLLQRPFRPGQAANAEALSRDRWYLVVSNHPSWTDIIVLQTELLRHVPVLKFFTKQELVWITSHVRRAA